MTPTDKFLDQAEERLKAATPGPWRSVRNNAMGETWFNIFARDNDNVLAMLGDLDDKLMECPNAQLIASSPETITRLLGMVRVLRAGLSIYGCPYCVGMPGSGYPKCLRYNSCRTIAECDSIASGGMEGE